MRKLSLLCVLFIALAGCGELLDPAAAVVHGNKITIDDVTEGIADFEASPRFQELAEEGDPDRIRRQFEQGYLATLVRRAVLEPWAEEFAISVDRSQVEAQIELIKADFPDEQAFQDALEQQALNEEELQVLIRDQILEEAIREQVTLDVTPTEADIQAYFEENQDQARDMRAQHILVESRQLARRLAQQLQEAENVDRVFARLARQHSTDESSARRGGRLETSRPGQLVPEFEQAAAELEIGEVSDPVQTQFGWHIIRVLERRELTIDDMRDQITGELLQPLQEEAWARWLADAYEDAGVRVNPRYGELDPETGQIVDATAETIPGGEGRDPGLDQAPGFDELEDHDHDDHDH